MSPTRRVYNVLIQRLHPSQHVYLKVGARSTLPTVVDLRSRMPPVYDQGELGSCSAQALCALVSTSTFRASRLFVYYNERKLENDIPDDSGAALSDGVLSLQKYGVCSELLWPYNITQFADVPPSMCYQDAKKHKIVKAHTVACTLPAMQQCLQSGVAFVVGIVVYDSFESDTVARTGMVPMPNRSTDTMLGGHAVVCVGYDASRKLFLMRNSWGTAWGLQGYFYLPFAYLLDPTLSSDAWALV